MKNRLPSIGLVIAALSMISSPSGWAADGATLFKSKCTQCHGTNGEGKPAMKAPALTGTTKGEDDFITLLTKGEPQKKAPHTKSLSGIDETQAKAIAEYVRTLK